MKINENINETLPSLCEPTVLRSTATMYVIRIKFHALCAVRVYIYMNIHMYILALFSPVGHAAIIA